MVVSLFDKQEYVLAKNKKIPSCLQLYQQTAKNLINPLSIYSSLLLFFQVGTGKTLASIEIAENFISNKQNGGIDKCIVIVKNDLIKDNFIRELIFNRCSSHYINSVVDKELITSDPNILSYNQKETRLEILRKARQRISMNYSFITYGTFTSKGKSLSNKVIIIDEVHNITRNSSVYSEIIKTLKRSTNYKIILLSATPMYNSVVEIFKVSNLLNEYSSHLPIGNDLIAKKYVYYRNTKPNLVSNNVVYLTLKGKKAIINALDSKVLYVKANEDNFPKVKVIGNGNNGSGDGIMNLFLCPMQPLQKHVYQDVSKAELIQFNNPNGDDEVDLDSSSSFLFTNSTDASTIVYPDGTYGKSGFLNNMTVINKKRNIWKPNSDFLHFSNIEKYSSKLFHLISNIKKTHGLVFIYSNFVNYRGLALIYAFLQYNKFNKVLILDSSKSMATRNKLLNLFNSSSNINGEKYNILLGSPLLSEGVTLKNIRQVHIIEPFWNYSNIDQIIGRAVRHNSHAALPLADRKVDIFKYASSGVPISYNIDILKYKLSEAKDISIKEVEYIIKVNTIDCNFHKELNNRHKVDYSRDCEYTKCNYTCVRHGCGAEEGTVDITTFQLREHAIYLYNYILEKIKSFYLIHAIGHIDDLVAYIQVDTGKIVDIKEYTQQVLEDIVQQQIPISTGSGRETTLFYTKQDFYIKDDVYNSFKKENFYYKVNKHSNQGVITKQFTEPTQQNSSSSILPPTQRTINYSTIPNLSSIVSSPIYGTMVNKFDIVDDKFRIVDHRTNTKNIGKVCTTSDTRELLDIAAYLKIKIPNSTGKPTKKILCRLIYDHLSSKKLIIL